MARTKPSRVASSARSTRPPSIGKAGIMLNTARNRFTAASRSTSETCALSTAERSPALSRAPASSDQADGDRDVDQRAGDRDQEFLARLLRDALEPRHAADRQQRHVGRRDAEGARREDVAELVRQHAGEQQQQEDRGSATPPPARRDVQLATKIQPRNSRNVMWTRTAVPAMVPILSDQDMEPPARRNDARPY